MVCVLDSFGCTLSIPSKNALMYLLKGSVNQNKKGAISSGQRIWFEWQMHTKHYIHDHFFFVMFIEKALSEHFPGPSVGCSLNTHDIMLVLLPIGHQRVTNLCLLHKVVILTFNRVKDKQKSVKIMMCAMYQKWWLHCFYS